MFKAGADRDGYILFEDLEHVQSREIKDVIEITHPEVGSQRVLSYVATTIIAVGLATSTLIYSRITRYTKKKPSIETEK